MAKRLIPEPKTTDIMRILWNMATESKCFDNVFKMQWHDNKDSEDCDWSAHNVSGNLQSWEWVQDSPYIEFEGSDGPVIVIGTSYRGSRSLHGDVVIGVPTFLILKPFTWTEHGSPMTDYEPYQSTSGLSEALGIMAHLLVSDRTKQYCPFYYPNDEVEQ